MFTFQVFTQTLVSHPIINYYKMYLLLAYSLTDEKISPSVRMTVERSGHPLLECFTLLSVDSSQMLIVVVLCFIDK